MEITLPKTLFFKAHRIADAHIVFLSLATRKSVSIYPTKMGNLHWKEETACVKHACNKIKLRSTLFYRHIIQTAHQTCKEYKLAKARRACCICIFSHTSSSLASRQISELLNAHCIYIYIWWKVLSASLPVRAPNTRGRKSHTGTIIENTPAIVLRALRTPVCMRARFAFL